MDKIVILPESLKRKIVLEVLSGKLSKEQARRVYGIKSKSGILEWMRKFASIDPKAHGIDPIPKLKTLQDDTKEILDLKSKIKNLEAQLKYTEFKGRAYQIMVEIAKEQYNLDLEKKFGAKQFKDLKQNKTK
jgi:transposase-like protein